MISAAKSFANLPDVLAIDCAGLDGTDGPTTMDDPRHLRCVAYLLIPPDEDECHRQLTTADLREGTSAGHYPRGTGPWALIEPGLNA